MKKNLIEMDFLTNILLATPGVEVGPMISIKRNIYNAVISYKFSLPRAKNFLLRDLHRLPKA